MTGCFCCTCPEKITENNLTIIYKVDPACRSHGAHGLRECVTHKSSPVPCTWGDGCGMTLDKIISLEH